MRTKRKKIKIELTQKQIVKLLPFFQAVADDNLAANWKQPLKWSRQAAAAGVRRRVFCASLADVFEDRSELESWRVDLMKLIELTHDNLDWLLLTKRPENVVRLIELAQLQAGAGVGAAGWLWHTGVWIGASVEDQEQADKRISELLRIDARVRFLSMEPLLGPVDLYGRWLGGPAENRDGSRVAEPRIHWVIVGGESGRKARPMHPDWVRGIRDQCQAGGVPFFFKQWGEWCYPSQMADGERRAWDVYHGTENVEECPVKLGKKRAGRLLDGREWNEYPAVCKELT